VSSQRGNTVLLWLDKVCPPFLAYSMAMNRNGGRLKWLGPGEVARRSGLPLRTVCRVAAKTSWASVKVSVMDAFMQGCGVDPFHMRRHREYITRTMLAGNPMPHLSTRDYKTFSRRVAAWKKSGKTIPCAKQ
jgi:hypothetical protein